MTVSIGNTIRDAAEELRAAGINQPRLEAVLLLSHTLGCDRTFLIARRVG